MKFIYQYRTSDNAFHEGVIKAPSREDVFTILKKQGIKPGRVVEAPGIFNKLFGKHKRWIAIASLATIAILFAYKWSSATKEAMTEARCQIYGDPAVMQTCEAANWTNVFAIVGDAFLAQYAQPGIIRSNTTNIFQLAEVEKSLSSLDGLSQATAMSDEARKMIRIVNGMREELREYLQDGGSVKGYMERLEERQIIESKIYNNIKIELFTLKRKSADSSDKTAAIKEWNDKNSLLRDMGLKSIPLPDEW